MRGKWPRRNRKEGRAPGHQEGWRISSREWPAGVRRGDWVSQAWWGGRGAAGLRCVGL